MLPRVAFEKTMRTMRRKMVVAALEPVASNASCVKGRLKLSTRDLEG
ncbi:hypothetical protein JMUB7489_26920 [Staphylococcus aureus]